MTIPIPKGFTVPKGLKQGDTFDVSAQLRIASNGLELVMIDDVPLAEAEMEEEEAVEDTDMAAAYEAAMAAPQVGPPAPM